MAFRKKLEKLGLVARYQGVEGGNETFRTQVDLHLRKVAARLVAAEQASRASTASNASGSSPVSVLAADGRSIVVNGPATLVDKALCVGLLGGAVHDLSVMRYQPSDPRYQQLLRDVEAVFEPQWLG